jgi:hypothetical protein
MGRCAALVCLLFGITGAATPARAATVTFDGHECWLNGVNVPWNVFGVDMGAHADGYGGYDEAWFEAFFAECASSRVNCACLWIHCDGRASPEFDAAGYVTGLDPSFLTDLESIFASADAHGVLVIPCLWSFDMTEDRTAGGGPDAGLHADLIADAAKTQSYIDNALVPIVGYFDGTPNLLAWEIMNEPEWSVTGDTLQIVTRTEMQRFCAMMAEAIHEHSSAMVTLGSASLKWSSDISPAEGNWWSDAALQSAYPSSSAVHPKNPVGLAPQRLTPS